MQATSFFNRPKFTVTTITPAPEVAEAYLRASANLQTLKNRDRVAYDAMIARIDGAGETWQAVDVDVCRELDRLDNLSEHDEISAMRKGA
jgi:hypothetical protein